MVEVRFGWSGSAWRRTALAPVAAAMLAAAGGPAAAYDFEPAQPLDTAAVDPALLSDLFGAWEIRDAAGKRRCRVTLLRETGIGGYQIEVAPACRAAFPVMDDVTAWRVNQGWSIDFVDALRKVRLRFETPDNRYVAFGEPRDIAGMDRFEKLPDRPRKER